MRGEADRLWLWPPSLVICSRLVLFFGSSLIHSMLVGAKVAEPSAVGFLREVADEADFVEVIAVVGNDYSFIREFDLPVVLHNKHYSRGVNFADPHKDALNRESLEFSLKLADELCARAVIVHPESRENDGCSEDVFARLLSDYPDRRILIESMPYDLRGRSFFAYDRESMGRLMARTGRGMCLDFAHASEAAHSLGKDPIIFVKELLSLEPAHYHISDTVLAGSEDLHLHLGEGDLPIGQFKRLLPKDAWVTLETPPEGMKTKKDIEYLRA